MNRLSTGQRLMAHLNKNGENHYASIIAKTERILAEDNFRKSEPKATTGPFKKVLVHS